MSARILKSGTTSFRKKGSEVLNIRGTRISVHNAQLLTSTGSSTLDFFIGGGLAVGTICVVEEDRYSTYSTLLLKYFLAEGVTCNHSILLASGDKDAKDILKELPSVKVPETNQNVKQSDSTESDILKIAWRYQSQDPSDSKVKMDSYNHGYDLSKTMPEEMLEKCHITTWDPSDIKQDNEDKCFLENPFSDLIKKIKSEILSGGLKTSSKTAETIMRIGICSIGSPLWTCSNNEQKGLNMIRFIYLLKSLLRTSLGVAFVTVPSDLMQDSSLICRLRQISDTVIGLESFVGSEKKSNPLFKDYDGLLRVIKLPVLNTLMYQPRTSDLAFKKRKGFLIERLHLPPDIEDPPPGEQGSFGCSGQASRLDF